MKDQPNSQPVLRSTSKAKETFSIRRRTTNSNSPVKPLLKASTTLPASKSFDETGGFIKGYN